jgi:hypothetical protein
MGRIATFGEVRPPAEQKRSACGGLCNSCNYYKLRGARSNGPFAPDNGVVRLRQHGTVFSFAQKNSQREFFCAKDRESSVLPEPALSVVEWGDIPRKTRNRLIPISSGRFAGFAHVAAFVVQTPTA